MEIKPVILMTEPFMQACSNLENLSLERRTEHAEGLRNVTVYLLDYQGKAVTAAARSFWVKLKMFGILEGYLLRRLFMTPRWTYNHLHDAESHGSESSVFRQES